MPVRKAYVKADPSPKGWGVAKDPVAARQYYETAANLGDTDAMEEAAWCYLEGFGGAKDKVRTLFSHIIVYPAPALGLSLWYRSATLQNIGQGCIVFEPSHLRDASRLFCSRAAGAALQLST